MATKKNYKTLFIVLEGNKFWSKEFSNNFFLDYSSAFKNVVETFKLYPEITNGIIYTNKKTAISLTRNILINNKKQNHENSKEV
jgi:hypothetical protein